MSIIYDPARVVQKIASDRKIKSMLKQNLSLKKAALNFADKYEIIDKKDVTKVALKTIKGYKERIEADPDLKAEILK